MVVLILEDGGPPGAVFDRKKVLRIWEDSSKAV